MGVSYHLLYLCLDVAERPFKVGHFSCPRFAIRTRGQFNGPHIAHGGRGVDHKHGHCVLYESQQLLIVQDYRRTPALSAGMVVGVNWSVAVTRMGY